MAIAAQDIRDIRIKACQLAAGLDVLALALDRNLGLPNSAGASNCATVASRLAAEADELRTLISELDADDSPDTVVADLIVERKRRRAVAK